MKHQKHGYATGGISPTYWRWYAMVSRCHRKNDSSYSYYGGRGIKVCERWRRSLKKFIEDMGEWPENKTLDRINNNGPYCKENCRWATRKEQRANQRPAKNTKYLIFEGKRKTLKEWSKEKGINYVTLHARIYRYGYSTKRALKNE